MKNLEEKLEKLLILNKISLSEVKIKLIVQYVELLLKHNENINLISRKDIENILEHHIIPCLIFSTLFKNFNQWVLDIGTGGGLPGIPFAILNEKSRITLIDSIRKKINVVKEIVQKIGLDNVEIIWTRAEEKKFIEKYKNSFDLIISRATADLQTLIEYSIPLVRDEASLLAAMKGGSEIDLELLTAKRRFNYITLQKIPLIYLPENPENINKKYTIIVERIYGRK